MKTLLVRIIPKSVQLFYHRMLAILAASLYRHPSEKLVIIGVTGTDGKTTTVNLISKLLDAAGKKNAFMATANFKMGDKEWVNETKQTMPGRFRLQKFLKEALRNGCTHVIVETSSQGIEQSRHLGINYDLAVFTNLSRDHIEAHGSYENYRKEKEKLFLKLSHEKKKENQIKKTSIINVSDKEASHFLRYRIEQRIGFGFEDEINVSKEDLESVSLNVVSDISLDSNGTSFKVNTKRESFDVRTILLGKFNILNAQAAISCALALGISSEVIKDAFMEMEEIPGRLELIDEGQDFMVVVDYAHAENSLQNVFETLEPVTSGKIISVLGSCGGGRDKEKRPKLGAIAARKAEVVIVTNEDPYDEDPMEIIKTVSKGALENGKILDQNLFEILERKEAIKKAFSLAKEGDLVLITGKGSEQCIMAKQGKKIPWDDRKVARELLKV